MGKALEVQRRPALKKNSAAAQSPKRRKTAWKGPLTIGMDLGDRMSCYCALNAEGDVAEEGKVATTKKGLAQAFGARRRCRIAIEVGTHSP